MPLLANGNGVPRNARVIRNMVTSEVSLAEAADRATERAQTWSSEARMVKAEAAWVLPSRWKEYETPPVAWSFYYYEPTTKNLAAVVIDDEATLWVPPFEISMAPTPFSTFPPTFDVDLAWLSFRASGGEEFLEEHPQAQVNFHLKQRQDALIWNVSAFDETDYMKVVIDAQSGVVLGRE
jgi:hypothetical protein